MFLLTARISKHLAGGLAGEKRPHERDEKLVKGDLATRHQLASVPETKSENKVLD